MKWDEAGNFDGRTKLKNMTATLKKVSINRHKRGKECLCTRSGRCDDA